MPMHSSLPTLNIKQRDSYVAVAGLPEARKDHAEVMARFAHKCLLKMNALVHKLETTLGPGTAELKMRVGLHRQVIPVIVLSPSSQSSVSRAILSIL